MRPIDRNQTPAAKPSSTPVVAKIDGLLKKVGLEQASGAGVAPRAGSTPLRPQPMSFEDTSTNASVGSSLLGLAVVSSAKTSETLIPMRTSPRNLELGEITGHVRRSGGKKGRPEATFYPDDRQIKPFTLDPVDAQGIAEGGRVTVQATEKGLLLDTTGTEVVRSAVGTVVRDGDKFAIAGLDSAAPIQRLPVEGADANMLGKTVLAHVVSPFDGSRRAQVRSVFAAEDTWAIAFSDMAVRRGVEGTFSDEASAEVAKLRQVFNSDKIAGYTDLTDKDFITIDNTYSKDFDQAMYIEPSKDTPGANDIYYAIADTSYFFDLLGPKSAIAERARRLQTTQYLPGLDFPILDRALSEDITSLIPNAKRPSFVIKYTVGDDGKVVGKPTFIDGVIKSRISTNYQLAQDYIDGKAKVDDPMLRRSFDVLKKVGGSLLEQAKARGMLSSEEGERWGTIDPKTHELVLEKRGQRWIEEANAQISITANALVGEFLVEHNAPAYHRIHKAADEARIQLNRESVRALGVDWPNDVSAAEMLGRLDPASPKYRAVHKLVIRSQPRAVVSAEPTSHDGLKLAHYVQVTAPMRRQRDASNHGFVRDVRDGKPADTSQVEQVLGYAAMAQERESRVDREVRDCISAKALEPLSGKTVKAEVVSVSPRGFEVYIPEADIERFIPLPGQQNRLDDHGTVLHAGGEHPLTVRLCDTIDVRIENVRPLEGKATLVALAGVGETKAIKPQRAGEAQPFSAIRGDGFTSPMVGKRVTTEGVVTATNPVGFYIQPLDATSVDTSGGLLVRTRGARVTVGDKVSVTGTVREARDQNNEYARSIVELVENPVVTRQGTAQLPKPVDLSALGAPPMDFPGATDYWRKLLGQTVVIGKGCALSPSNRFGDLVVLPDGWSIGEAKRSRYGGVLYREGAENLAKASIKFRDAAGKSPPLSVGAVLGEMQGVVSYRSGDFQIELTKPPQIISNPMIQSETTRLVGDDKSVIVASVNMLNLNPNEVDRAKRLATRIVNNMKSPDVLSVQEIQDNDGPAMSDVVAADRTYAMVARLIEEAGGPHYEYIDVPPKNGEDGGEPGGNIRCGFLYRKDRVQLVEGSVKRIGEGNTAFMDSRKSLVARFVFKGHELEVVNDHFASRRGSSPWNGSVQPPIVGGADKRLGQAKAVREHLDGLRKSSPNVDALVVGDFNDTLGSATVKELTSTGLSIISNLVPAEDRFDYNYRGTQQILCPVIGTPGLVDGKRIEMQYLHANTVNPLDDSDHDHAIMKITYA